MPVRWEIRGSVLLLSFDGGYSADDLVQAVSDAMKAPAFKPGLAVLFDGRGSTAALSAPDIDWRVYWLASLPKKGFSRRCAIVVNRATHRYGLARMLSTRVQGEGVDLAIFHDPDEALAWLQGAGP